MQIDSQATYTIGNGYMGSGLAPFASRFGVSGRETATLRSNSQDNAGISQTFAQDIVRRIQAESLEQEGGAQSQDTLDELQQSLARAVDYVRANFGDAAAQATMGLVYKEIGNDPVSEDTLGQGLLQALRFVDSNFGFAAGDKLMSFFNSDLNQAVNEHFDNGLMEVFYAAAPDASQGMGQGIASALGQALGDLSQEYASDASKSLVEQFLAALEQGDGPYAALRGAVDATGQELAMTYGGEASDHVAVLEQAVTPLLQAASGVGGTSLAAQTGTMLNMVV